MVFDVLLVESWRNPVIKKKKVEEIQLSAVICGFWIIFHNIGFLKV